MQILVSQPEFHQSAFHTTYLDEILKARNGRPFVEPQPDDEDLAAVAGAMQRALSPRVAANGQAPAAGASPATPTAGATRWKARARQEGLR